MGIITLLITISITIAIVFLSVFVWSLRSGQFDDTTTPAMRMLFDDRIKQREMPEAKASSKPDKNQPHN
jgi:cbb3-type cytochrome oxidase maturation protein